MRDDDRIKLEDCDRLTGDDIACLHRWKQVMIIDSSHPLGAHDPAGLEGRVLAGDAAVHRRAAMSPPPPF